MRTFSYGDTDTYNEEKERRERWSNVTIPLVLLGVLIIAWIVYGKMMETVNGFSLEGCIEITGKVEEDGIHYKGIKKDGSKSDYRISNSYGYSIGETIVIYQIEGEPENVYVPHTDYSWLLVFPLLLLTGLDVFWIYKVMKPKKKHYIPQENQAKG